MTSFYHNKTPDFQTKSMIAGHKPSRRLISRSDPTNALYYLNYCHALWSVFLVGTTNTTTTAAAAAAAATTGPLTFL